MEEGLKKDLIAALTDIIKSEVALVCINDNLQYRVNQAPYRIIDELNKRGLLSPEFSEDLEQEKYRHFVD